MEIANARVHERGLRIMAHACGLVNMSKDMRLRLNLLDDLQQILTPGILPRYHAM